MKYRFLFLLGRCSREFVVDGKVVLTTKFESVLNFSKDLCEVGNIFGYLNCSMPVGEDRFEFQQDCRCSNIVYSLDRTKYGVHSMNPASSIYSGKFVNMFSQDVGFLPIDAIVTSQYLESAVISSQLGNMLDKVPVILVHHDGVYETRGSSSNDAINMIPYDKLVGSCCHLMWIDSQKELLRRVCKSNTNSVNTKKHLDEVIVSPPGVNILVTEKYRSYQRKGSIVGHFGSFNSTKGGKFVLDIYKKLFVLGKIDKAIFTSFGGFDSDFNDSFIEKHSGTGREEYLRLASQCKVMLNGSSSESFGLTALECMSLGMAVVLPRRQWSVCVVGDDYPLLYKPNDSSEAFSLVCHALENYEKYKELSISIANRYDSRRCMKDIVDKLCAYVDKVTIQDHPMLKDLNSLRCGYKKLDMMVKILDQLGDCFRFNDFIKEVNKSGINVYGIGQKIFMNSGLKRVLDLLGYEDRLDDVSPMMFKMK